MGICFLLYRDCRIVEGVEAGGGMRVRKEGGDEIDKDESCLVSIQIGCHSPLPTSTNS